MKKILFFVLLFNLYFSYGQSQFGVLLEGNLMRITTNDLTNVETSAGYGIGMSSLKYISKSSDLILEIYYSAKFASINGYIEYDNSEVEFEDKFKKIKIGGIHFNALYNKYLIVPDLKKINLSIQGGLGVSALSWSSVDTKDDNFFYDRTPLINPYFLIGLSTGTEQIRFSIRYSRMILNTLKGVSVSGVNNNDNPYNTNTREFKANESKISLSITYYFNTYQ